MKEKEFPREMQWYDGNRWSEVTVYGRVGNEYLIWEQGEKPWTDSDILEIDPEQQKIKSEIKELEEAIEVLKRRLK